MRAIGVELLRTRSALRNGIRYTNAMTLYKAPQTTRRIGHQVKTPILQSNAWGRGSLSSILRF